MGIGGVVAALLLLSVEGTALGKYFVTDARTYSIDTQNGDLTTELRMCEMQERERSRRALALAVAIHFSIQ